MFVYIVKLFVVLALVSGMAVGALWLLRKSQPHLSARVNNRRLSVVESLSLGPTVRLTVVRFGDEHLLLSHGRAGVQTLASRAASRTEALVEGGHDA